MATSPTTETWCVDDTLFYPLGLINHTTGNKTVFVTWSDKHLMNFIFKKVSQGANRCNKFVINVPEEIIDIIILEVNTLVLLQNGEVCYFSSIKSIHRIPWLSSGIKCINQSLDGFSLIRVLEDRRISLEVYKDVPNVGKTPQEAVKSYDLSFDDANVFDSDWRDEKFTLISVQITERNSKFMELLVRNVDLPSLEIHVFSISNSLFALYATDGEDYEIKPLSPQIATVELVKYLADENMFLILLNCGIIEVWYMSRISLIIEKFTYINDSEFVHYTFAGDFLYFTDEQRVCRLKFSYDPVEHICRTTEQSIEAPGMVAVTYEEGSGSIVCLNNNNVFYHLSFNDTTEEDDENALPDHSLFELTDEKVQEMLNKSQLIEEINSLPNKIDKQIEEEYKKQELIAVSRKSAIYSELISAQISFSQHIPETEERLIYPGDNGIPSFTYFAVVSVKILSHEIFKSTIWNLMIAYTNHVRLLRITPELLREKFSVLIPVKRNYNELIPEFEIQMLAHVNLEQDFVCISIPVKIKESNVKKLFSKTPGLTKLPKESDPKLTTFLFKATTPALHANHVRKIFGIPGTESLEVDVFTINLYFLGHKVSIFFSESTKIISVESCDPVAVYYAKICVSKYFWENFEQTSDYEDLRKTLLELQCQVERKYGGLAEKELHISNLKRIYEKLRKEIVWKF